MSVTTTFPTAYGQNGQNAHNAFVLYQLMKYASIDIETLADWINAFESGGIADLSVTNNLTVGNYAKFGKAPITTITPSTYNLSQTLTAGAFGNYLFNCDTSGAGIAFTTPTAVEFNTYFGTNLAVGQSIQIQVLANGANDVDFTGGTGVTVAFPTTTGNSSRIYTLYKDGAATYTLY